MYSTHPDPTEADFISVSGVYSQLNVSPVSNNSTPLSSAVSCLHNVFDKQLQAECAEGLALAARPLMTLQVMMSVGASNSKTLSWPMSVVKILYRKLQRSKFAVSETTH